MLFAFSSCNEKADNENTSSGDMPATVTGSITFKEYGTMKFELYLDKVPNSCLNFIYLAQQGYYEGVVVHRLVKDFVIQAGAFTTGYAQKAGVDYSIKGDFSDNGVTNPVNHKKGTLAWARANANDSASTQFYICTSDATAAQLDGRYAAFGMITEGFDIIDEINGIATDMYDRPVHEVMIEKVVIDSDYNFPEPEKIK